ncbi:MAG: glycosyltransferase family 4 protein [Candidatus Pacebacteria bacterium]|nr:glycosyltransferase family 4 protein [Candidatus Paceibacterota bacterium]
MDINRLRINFITCSCHLTGGNRVVMECINGLAKLGHKVSLITLGSPKDLSWIDLNADVYFVKKTFLQKIVSFLYRKVFGYDAFPEEETKKILKILPESDINVATISYLGYVSSRAMIGMPFHYFMHYEPYVRDEGYKKRIIEEAYYLPTKKIVNSTWVKNTIKKETDQDVEGIVLPAIDHNVFYPRKEKKPCDKSKKIKIVSLVKHKEWKGVPDALRAIDMVRKRGYDIEFLGFGPQFTKDMLPDDVKDIDFTCVGFKANEELAEFYSDADIVVSTSFFESFPLPQLEAMTCGTPVVTTKYGTEDYAVDGENSFVVEPKKPELVADAIVKLIESKDIYIKFSENGIKTAKKFTWDQAADQMEKIFLNAVSKKK